MKGMGTLGASIALVVIGLPVASFFMVFRPMNKEVVRLKEEISHREGLLAKLQEETARNADLERANAEIAESIRQIETRLPSGQDVDKIVRQVSDIATEVGLIPPSIKSGKAVPVGLYMEQPLEMTTAGSFIAFRTFLARVEKLERVTRIHDMKITQQIKNNQEIGVTFTLSIYFQDDSKDKKVASAN
jgi:type IV pilus assembly protein PilO